MIKKAGFDCVMLWWSDKFGRGNGYQEDVRFAKNAGLFGISVTWGFRERAFLEEHGATCFIDAPKEILSFVTGS